MRRVCIECVCVPAHKSTLMLGGSSCSTFQQQEVQHADVVVLAGGGCGLSFMVGGGFERFLSFSYHLCHKANLCHMHSRRAYHKQRVECVPCCWLLHS